MALVPFPIECKNDVHHIFCGAQGSVRDILCPLPNSEALNVPARQHRLTSVLGCVLSLDSLVQVVEESGSSTNVVQQQSRSGQVTRQDVTLKIVQVNPASRAEQEALPRGKIMCSARHVQGKQFVVSTLSTLSWLPGYCGCRPPHETWVSCPMCQHAQTSTCNSSPTTSPESCCCGTLDKPCACPPGFTSPLTGCRQACQDSAIVTRCNNQGTCSAGAMRLDGW